MATPGRLEDLIQQRSVDLSRVDFVVVDEADRMSDMGFLPAVRRILDRTSRNRQTMLFSATLDGAIAVLSRDYQTNPVRHDAPAVDTETIDATHHFWLVNHHDRVGHTADAVDAAGSSIVFTRTRHGADRLAKQLSRLGMDAVAMHGGRSQNQRNRALRAFSTGRAQALIATDVAARGIHVDSVDLVIHFDPQADHKDYLHRSGRTARAGARGTVVSLVTGQQRREVQRMQKALDLDAPIEKPRLDALGQGGQRVGDPGRDRPRSEHSPRQSQRPGGRESVYVSNLPWGATADELRSMFGDYGEVHDITIITDKRGRSKGFGFVDMSHPGAGKAVAALQGSSMGGRDLVVRMARPKKQRR